MTYTNMYMLAFFYLVLIVVFKFIHNKCKDEKIKADFKEFGFISFLLMIASVSGGFVLSLIEMYYKFVK